VVGAENEQEAVSLEVELVLHLVVHAVWIIRR